MRELFTLIKVNMQDMLDGKFKHRIYIFLAGLAIMLAMAYYTMILMTSLPKELYYIVVYIMGAASLFFTFITTISLSFGYIIGFKDHDLLLSLPLKPSNIYLSKLLGLIIVNLLYYLCFMLPSMLCYGIMAKMEISYYLLMIFGMIFQPLAIIAIGTMISLLFAKFSGNGRYRQLITNLFTVIFVILIMALSFSFSSLEQGTQATGVFYSLYEKIKIMLPTLYWYISGSIVHDGIKVLLSICINVLILSLFVRFSNKMLFKLNQNYSEEYHDAKFKIKGIQTSSTFITLLKKELKGFFLNFNYFFNLGIGSVMSILALLYLLFNYHDELNTLLAIMPQEMIETGFLCSCLIIAFMNMIDCTSCVSISLEGKTLWILKSLPIDVMEVFLAKILVNFIIVFFSSLLDLLIIIFIIPVNYVYIIMAIILLALISIFVGCFGLVINLKFPKLVWDREIIVIKQSLSSFLSVISLMIIGIAIGIAGYYLSISLNTLISLMFLIIGYLITDILLYFLLKKWGKRKFMALSN